MVFVNFHTSFLWQQSAVTMVLAGLHLHKIKRSVAEWKK
nr:MAG TPA: hypothetical protein [Caudoviricetes sp.]